MRLQWRIILATTCLMIVAGIGVGCGQAIRCLTQGDNVRGRVVFSDAVASVGGAKVVVEASSDSFATVIERTVVLNSQNLLSVPYSFCVAPDTDLVMRAYQDLDSDAVLDAGEGSGQDDSTQNGNSTFITRRIDASTNTSGSSSWPRIDVDIYLDHMQ